MKRGNMGGVAGAKKLRPLYLWITKCVRNNFASVPAFASMLRCVRNLLKFRTMPYGYGQIAHQLIDASSISMLV